MSDARIEAKLDKVVETVAAIAVEVKANSVTLERNTKDVEHHVKRTDLLEKRIDEVRRFMWMAMGMVALITFVMGVLQLLK